MSGGVRLRLGVLGQALVRRDPPKNVIRDGLSGRNVRAGADVILSSEDPFGYFPGHPVVGPGGRNLCPVADDAGHLGLKLV